MPSLLISFLLGISWGFVVFGFMGMLFFYYYHFTVLSLLFLLVVLSPALISALLFEYIIVRFSK